MRRVQRDEYRMRNHFLFSDRTLRLGRNVYIIAATSLILSALEPDDFDKFQPFGIPFSQSGQWVIWTIFLVVMVFNLLCWAACFQMDFFEERTDPDSKFENELKKGNIIPITVRIAFYTQIIIDVVLPGMVGIMFTVHYVMVLIKQ